VGHVESEPSSAAARSAIDDLDRIIRTARLVIGGCLLLALVGLPLSTLPDPLFALLAWALGLTFAALYAIAWRRARVAQRLIENSEPRAVWAIGWERPPDGANYALFLHGSADDDPDFVVRLPLRRDLRRSTAAWVYGRLEPDILGGVALVGPDGLLATGRVVGRRSARGKWRRFGTEPSGWVRRPPEDWLPPGGH